MTTELAAAPASTDVVLRLTDVHTYYGAIHALRGLDVEVRRGEIVTLIGANGAGKTTTLRTISGLLHARQGSVELNGVEHHQGRSTHPRRPRASATRRRAGGSSPG